MEPPDERIVEQYLEAEQERNDNAFLGTVADAQRALDAEREKVKELEEQLRLANCDQANTEADLNDVTAQLATLQAQLRQVEGERNTARHRVDELESREIDVEILQGDLTTLRQLVEAFRSSEEWGAVKAWMVEGAPTRQEGVEAAKRITKAQYEMENALVGCRQALAAQDAVNVCTNHFSDGSKIFPSRHCECKPHPTEERHE